MGPGVWSIKAVAVCGRESHGSGAADKGQADHAKPNRSMPNPNHIRSVGIIELFHKERHPRTQSLNVPSKEILGTEKLLHNNYSIFAVYAKIRSVFCTLRSND